MNQKSIIAILGIVIVILIGTIVYFATTKNVSQPAATTSNMVQEPVPTPAAQLPSQPATTQPIDKTASWQIYQNEKYGFEVTLTDAWQGYKVVERVEKDERYSNESIVTFSFLVSNILPKSDSQWLLVFDLIRISKSKWERMEKEGPPTPGTIVAKNDFYVFSYRLPPHDLAPEEKDLLEKEINFLEIYKVISTFKFTK